jgi:peptidyl-prolyl cis-trans isomerase B (cyclophilin B)
MHLLLLPLLFLASILTPTRTWYPPAGPVTVNVTGQGDTKLVLTDFTGAAIPPTASADVSGEKTVDLKTIFPKISAGGTFVLFTVPKDKTTADFTGNPLVIESVVNPMLPPGSGPDVIKIEPLQYAVIHNAHGNMTAIFYYDVARNTVDSFLRLASQGYYDKLTFHRIVPGFVLQGGDPRGDGMGGPGYQIGAEFNDRPHEEGVLSMARSNDPNSGGSQFFICLDYKNTQHLDHQYTAFGKVVDGMAAAHEIEKTPLADAQNGSPATPQVIDQIEVKPVTAAENPYASLFHMERPTTIPDTAKEPLK